MQASYFDMDLGHLGEVHSLRSTWGKAGPPMLHCFDSNKYPLVIITMVDKDRSNLILPNLKVQCRLSDMVNGWHL